MSARVVVSVGAEERARAYVAALRAVGVERVTVLTPAGGAGAGSWPTSSRSAAAHAAEALSGAAGVLLGGGLDVDPRRFGEAVLPGAGVEILPERDALEWELIAAARAARLPVWGICRGLQVLNVFFGGTLWQDLPSQRSAILADEVRHDLAEPPDALAHSLRVTVPQSALGDLLGSATALVNSRHHQGIRQLAPALTAVAVAPDGLIEAVELAAGSSRSPRLPGSADAAGVPDGWWVRAVQWHPENLVAMAQQRALWQDFAQAVAQAAEVRPALAR